MIASMKLFIVAATAVALLDTLLSALAIDASEMTKDPLRDMLTEVAVRLVGVVFTFHIFSDIPTLVVRPAEVQIFEVLGASFIPSLVTGIGHLIQHPIRTSISNVAVLIGMIPEVRFLLAVFVIATAHATGRLRTLKRAALQSDLWIFGYMVHELLSDAERHWATPSDLISARFQNTIKYLQRTLVRTSAPLASCLKAWLASPHRPRRSVSAAAPRHGGMGTVAVLGATILFESVGAAPIEGTNRKDLTCIVRNTTLANECLVRNDQDLNPEAKGVIALTVVLVVLTFVLVVFGIPQWAKDGLRSAWTLVRSRQPTHEEAAPVDETIPAEAVGDAETVNATAGGTVVESQHSAGRKYWLWFIPVPGFFARWLSRTPSRPIPHTSALRDAILAGVLHDVPEERPDELDDADLGVEAGASVDGFELQEMAAAGLDREHVQQPRQGLDTTPTEATIMTAVGTVDPVQQTSGDEHEQNFVPQPGMSSASPSTNASKTPFIKWNTY